jgi:hypothetical protein
MESRAKDLDEQELADNQLHFEPIIWKNILWALISVGILDPQQDMYPFSRLDCWTHPQPGSTR